MQNCPLLSRLLVLAWLFASAAVAPGNEASLPAALDRQLTASWQGQDLGTVLQRIAAAQKVSLWVDRRVDTGHIVNAQFTDAQLARVLDQILDNAELGWSRWDEMIYVGPRDSARELATLMAIARRSVDRLPASRRAVWLTAAPTSWPRLSDPRSVLADWLQQAGIAIKNPTVLSHDLWDARQLPPLPLVDRVVFLLLGFDKTGEISASGQALEIVPIRRPVLITEQYEPGRRMRELLAAFRDDPSVEVSRQGNRVAITGRWEDQQRARQIIEGADPARNARRVNSGRGTERRFSLKLENQPVEKVIAQLANQLGLTVTWQDRALEQRSQVTSCDVNDGTLEDLLAAVLEPVELGFVIDGQQLTILPEN